jgi:D-alanyl-D-alanine carboxypeptidase
VIAKTGTTSISSSLAGFVRGRYAFAVLHSGSPVPTREARAAQDRFVALLAAA